MLKPFGGEMCYNSPPAPWLYWDLCEKVQNIKVNKSMIEGTVFRQHIYEMRTIVPSKGDLFCKPFDQMGHSKANAEYNWFHGHSLLMNLGNTIEIWKRWKLLFEIHILIVRYVIDLLHYTIGTWCAHFLPFNTAADQNVDSPNHLLLPER